MIKEKIKEFFFRDWTIEEKVLLLADILLAGVLLGWLTSPFKGGFFSHNSFDNNAFGSHFGKDEVTLELDEEEGEE